MCHCCNDARPDPASYRLFAEGCLHCAARRIQYLQRVIFKDDNPHIVAKRQERCRKALSDAIANGLDGVLVRTMARASGWQVAPQINQRSIGGK